MTHSWFLCGDLGLHVGLCNQLGFLFIYFFPKEIDLMSKPTFCCLRRRRMIKGFDQIFERWFWSRRPNTAALRCYKAPPPSIKTHTHLSMKCMEALRHNARICRLPGCVRLDGERKIGGGEWLHQESRRREKWTVSFLQHATRSHRETEERRKKTDERKRGWRKHRSPSAVSAVFVRLLVLHWLCGPTWGDQRAPDEDWLSVNLRSVCG